MGLSHDEEIRMYSDSFSLLVIGPKGIRRIYTPFTVKPRIRSGRRSSDEVLKVTRILLGNQDRIMFEINNDIFNHSLFLIP